MPPSPRTHCVLTVLFTVRAGLGYSTGLSLVALVLVYTDCHDTPLTKGTQRLHAYTYIMLCERKKVYEKELLSFTANLSKLAG